MNDLKNIASWLLLYVVGILFFFTASIYAVHQILKPDTIKSTFSQQGTYDKFVPALLETAHTQSSDSEAGQLPLQQDWVKQAAQKAFPASDIEQKSNTVIDSTFSWLDGKTSQPEFTLDFTKNKQDLGVEVGNYVQTRLSSLPVCTSADQIPAEINAYTITCLPPGVSPSVIASQVTSQIQNDQSFLKNPVLNSSTLTDEAKKNGAADPFEQLEGVRDSYQNRKNLEWLLPLGIILAALAGVYIASNRGLAVKRLYRSLFASAVGLLILYLVIRFAINSLFNEVPNRAAVTNLVLPVFQSLFNKAGDVYLIFSIIALVLGASLVFAHRRWFNATTDK